MTLFSQSVPNCVYTTLRNWNTVFWKIGVTLTNTFLLYLHVKTAFYRHFISFIYSLLKTALQLYIKQQKTEQSRVSSFRAINILSILPLAPIHSFFDGHTSPLFLFELFFILRGVVTNKLTKFIHHLCNFFSPSHTFESYSEL